MPRPKKDFEPINCKIEREIAEKLEKMCEDTGLSKTKVVEKALIKYIEEYNKTGKI